MFRKIVNMGEKLGRFFALDLQNLYYKYFMYYSLVKPIKKHSFTKSKSFKKRVKAFYKPYGFKFSMVWHWFYSEMNGKEDVRYIPENIYFYKIEPYMNRKDFSKAIDDKCYYHEIFQAYVKRPEPLVRGINGFLMDKEFNIIDLDKAFDICCQKERVVIKPALDGGGGKDVRFLTSGKYTKNDFGGLLKDYNTNFIIEDVIKQSKEMAYFNQTSVNTIRVITYLNGHGAHVLSAVIRMGKKGSDTDNFTAGGICAGITSDGYVKEVAYDHDFNQYRIHPDGLVFAGKRIPKFAEIKETAVNIHRRFAHFRIISWDFVVDENDEIQLIEFNFTPQGIRIHQVNNGPIFGDYTEEILSEVFLKK